MQNFVKIRPLVLLLMLLGCQADGFSHTSANSAPQSLAELKANMAFTCQHEHKPALSPETQRLYLYAHYQDLHNMWRGKKGDAIWQSTLPYYRIAAANGDYKANLRLQYLIKSGRVTVEKPQDEVLNLNEELALILPATAYYNMYGYLDVGFGVRTEKDGQYAFLRKAADLGSPDAQYQIGDILMRLRPDDNATYEFAQDLGVKFLKCAADQGSGIASNFLAIYYQRYKEYAAAVKYFQLSVKQGYHIAAIFLLEGFKAGNDLNNKDYLALKKDDERIIRYKMLIEYLDYKRYLNPTVPDLDEIVPLPPAKLPRWDGKIAFQRWFEGPSPAKPSDELMQKLAAKANLDWQTGLPLKNR